MSGIFRDKSFEHEAVGKTGAIAFLQKPFGPSDLLAALKSVFEGLVDEKQWSLQTILVRQMESIRDRVKMIEHLEQVRGVEAAFLLSILMDAKVSGYMNLVTDTGGIFGLKIVAGRLVAVDSEDADDIIIRFLIDTGYLTPEDWGEFSARESKKFPLQKLVATGYISPHAALQAQRDQIVFNLRRIFRVETINVNFAADRSGETTTDGLDLNELFADLSDTIDELLDEAFLQKFFMGNMASPIRTLDSFSFDHPVWKIGLVSRVRELVKDPKDNTLTRLITDFPERAGEILRAIYLLVMFRQILFQDPEKLKDFESEAARRMMVHDAIKDMDPFQIFGYFGTSPKANPAEVAEVFKEFVRANHPDKLPPDSPKPLREVTTAIFSMVSNAFDVLSDQNKREAFHQKQQAESATKQIRAETLSQEGAELIRRGSYSKAEEKLNMAMELSASSEIFILQVWARVKQQNKLSKTELVRIQKQLETTLGKDRANPRLHLVLGLVRVANGEQNAQAMFEKALSLNPNFVEARREINALQGVAKESGSSSASDILTGDITSLVSQLFKKKKAK